MGYTKLASIVKELDIHNGDNIFVSSDVTALLMTALKNRDTIDLNVFIDSLIDAIGDNATLMFPTYNWDFCHGIAFNYNTTPCKTGSLGKVALKRADFKRTLHPIYSFAVHGKDADLLCSMHNVESFGLDSPFAYMVRNRYKNLVIDVTLNHCFTLMHFVESFVGNLPYRYHKNFTANYFDQNNVESTRTYSMYVRNLAMHVESIPDKMQNIFIENNCLNKYYINNIEYKIIDMHMAFDLIKYDLLFKKGQHVCRYDGQ